MKSLGFRRGLPAICLAATVTGAFGQNAYQIFTPANVRLSTTGTGTGANANIFNTKTLNLSCPSPVHATISSTTDGSGNVLVDNFITVGVPGANQVNVCRNGTEYEGQPNCFNSTYGDEASDGLLTGQDPDGFTAEGGVPALDISSHLTPGTNQLQIGTVDSGFFLTSSTLYLVTNCTSNGISGSGQITGNPISSSNPTGQQLSQTYPVNTATNQQIQFTYDLSSAFNAGTLNINNGSTPTTGDDPLNPSTFQSTFLKGTSFATAQCLTHTGNLLNGSPSCVIYTLTCQVGTNPDQAGALCPASTVRNEFFVENFDGPAFTLPDIKGTNNVTYHQGVGFLETNEGWPGGSCLFDPASGISNLLCPQNVLTSFSGPGAYRSGGSGQVPNSMFITVAPVPEDLTTITVAGKHPGNWVNTQSPSVTFLSTPPALTSNGFVAAQIESITYGISGTSNVPQPPAPIAGDFSVGNGACPAPGSTPPTAKPFSTTQTIDFPADGQYLLHYYAQDCAGTQELQFTQVGGNWSTSFYTSPINVDTVPPVVVSGPTLSPPPSTIGGVPNSYPAGTPVNATYRCTDQLSGVVQCGTSNYTTGTKDTGNIMTPVDTLKAGPHTFTVNAVDAAGNNAIPASVSYNVVSSPPVNLGILKLAPLLVKHGSQMTYLITAANLGKQAASSVTVTDVLPSGLTLVKASAVQLVCNGQCSNQASCTTSGNSVSCTAPSMTQLTPMAVAIVVQVNAAAKTTIKNTATVGSSNPIVPPGNTQSTATTVVF
ncbi:MAG: hypothetical protein WA510_08820 [Acidobacteriaceae bacterium]